jgi:hypothetical protein
METCRAFLRNHGSETLSQEKPKYSFQVLGRFPQPFGIRAGCCTSELSDFPYPFSQLLRPAPPIAAVNDPPKKPELLRNVRPLAANVIFRDSGVGGQKSIHALGLREQVRGIT